MAATMIVMTQPKGMYSERERLINLKGAEGALSMPLRFTLAAISLICFKAVELVVGRMEFKYVRVHNKASDPLANTVLFSSYSILAE